MAICHLCISGLLRLLRGRRSFCSLSFLGLGTFDRTIGKREDEKYSSRFDKTLEEDDLDVEAEYKDRWDRISHPTQHCTLRIPSSSCLGPGKTGSSAFA